MFLRMLRLRVNPDTATSFLKRYVDVVIPGLRRVNGCLYAGLVQSMEDPADGISLTMWTSEKEAQAYAESETFTKLLDATREFFADSTEFSLQLSDNLELELRPVPADPEVAGFAADLPGTDPGNIARKHSAPMYLRIVSMHVQSDRFGEFARIYHQEVIPALRRVSGCQNAYLAAGEASGVALSITIWDTLQHARDYELSGEFDKLKDKLRPTFSHLALWKMGLDDSTPLGGEEGAPRAVTSHDVAVRTYSIVVGEAF
jgi:heme-degrading monooxygenase HmoA